MCMLRMPLTRLAAALARKTKRGNMSCESGPWQESALWLGHHGAGERASMYRRVAAMRGSPVCGRCDERTMTFCSHMASGLAEHARACDLVSLCPHPRSESMTPSREQNAHALTGSPARSWQDAPTDDWEGLGRACPAVTEGMLDRFARAISITKAFSSLMLLVTAGRYDAYVGDATDRHPSRTVVEGLRSGDPSFSWPTASWSRIFIALEKA